MAVMNRKGYGQVEPNHLSAQYTGQIYAQLPAMTGTTTGSGQEATTTWAPTEQLENGQFLKYDYTNGRACADENADGEWMLVFNEVKLYDERKQNYRYFAAKAANMSDGKIYPRLLKINIGDIFTTNTFKGQSGTVTDGDATITTEDLAIGNYVKIGSDGWLTKANTKPASGIVFKVVPHFTQIKDATVKYTLGDGQDAVKLQRVQ